MDIKQKGVIFMKDKIKVKFKDIKSLSEILGHSNVQITLNRYVHPSMDTKRKYINALSADYGQFCGQS